MNYGYYLGSDAFPNLIAGMKSLGGGEKKSVVLIVETAGERVVAASHWASGYVAYWGKENRPMPGENIFQYRRPIPYAFPTLCV